MPLHFIKEDIFNVPADIIVNPSDGVNFIKNPISHNIAIKAGEKYNNWVSKLKPIAIGNVVFSKAFNLNYQYIAHIALPTWRDGLRNEREYIDSCFSEILYGADDIKASSIVFSMAGCEFCGIPYEELLEISVKAISDYLSVKDNLTVFIAVMNDNIYNFVQSSYQGYCISSSQLKQAILCQSLEYKIEHLDYQFVDLLNVYIHRAGLSPVQCYSAAGIDKKLFSKIKNQRNYKPSKITIIKFAFALHLSLDETQQLLRTCGYILSESIIDDVIIMHYLSQRIYCLEDVDKEIKERSL